MKIINFYKADLSNFGYTDSLTDMRVNYWYSCRDELINAFTNSRESLVYKSIKPSETFAYIQLIHKILDVKNEVHLNRNYVVVLLGKFWKSHAKVGILSILLRAGRHYKNDNNWEYPLTISKYLKNESVFYAVKRFLSGHTKITLPAHRIKDTFFKMPIEEINKIIR